MDIKSGRHLKAYRLANSVLLKYPLKNIAYKNIVYKKSAPLTVFPSINVF